MPTHLRSLLVAASLSALTLPAFAEGYAPTGPLASGGTFAPTSTPAVDVSGNGPKTRAEVKAELAAAAANGTLVRLGNDPHYPDDVQGVHR